MRLAIALGVILAGLGYLVGRALGVNWYDLRDALLARWSKAWRWLLWSPRRFAVALLVIAAGFWGWAQLANSPSTSQAAPSPVDSTLPTGWREWPTVVALNAGVPVTSTAPATATPSSPRRPSTGTPTQSPTQSPTVSVPPRQDEQAAAAAVAFVAAWAHPERAKADWLAGLAPTVAAPFLESLRSVDPRNVPATKAGSATSESLNSLAGSFIVTTDTKPVRVAVQRFDTGWLATSVEPVTGMTVETH